MSTDQWDDTRVARWLAQAEGLDRQMRPITDALFAAAALRPAEQVLDVGMGHGPTTRRAAAEVGPDGAVTGVDIAGAMVAAAASVPAAPGSAEIDWIEADVVAWQPGGAAYDAVISRFGVMFFADPAAAFATLHTASAPGGRLCIATWAERTRSGLFQVPLDAAVPVLRARGVEVADLPVDGGAFSLGTPERLRAVLGDAGWAQVDAVEHQVELLVGGGLDPEAAGRAALELGPTRVITTGVADPICDEVAAAVAETYRDHTDAEGNVVLDGTFLITTAVRPA